MTWILDAFQGPLALGMVVFLDWWAVWFALGRSFLPTTFMVLSADGILLLVALGVSTLVETGAGPGALDWTLAIGGATLLKAGILRLWMLKLLPRWKWNRYDLALVAGSTALGFALSAWSGS